MSLSITYAGAVTFHESVTAVQGVIAPVGTLPEHAATVQQCETLFAPLHTQLTDAETAHDAVIGPMGAIASAAAVSSSVTLSALTQRVQTADATLPRPPGETGPVGLTGVPGNTGPTGTFVLGSTGPAGPAGAPGLIGLSGEGAQGSTGPTGPTGPSGPTGVKGVKGDTGPTTKFGATVDQHIIPSATNTYNLGSEAAFFDYVYAKTLYLSENSLTIGDLTISSAPDGSLKLPPNATAGGSALSGSGFRIAALIEGTNAAPPASNASAPVPSLLTADGSYAVSDVVVVNRAMWLCTDVNASSGALTWVELGNVQGEKGYEGAAGPRGTKGMKGQRGEKGEKGDAGVRGADGARGATGPRGQRGDAFSQIMKGVRGPQGDAGQRGEHGATGPAGQTGMRGPHGASIEDDPALQPIYVVYKHTQVAATGNYTPVYTYSLPDNAAVSGYVAGNVSTLHVSATVVGRDRRSGKQLACQLRSFAQVGGGSVPITFLTPEQVNWTTDANKLIPIDVRLNTHPVLREFSVEVRNSCKNVDGSWAQWHWSGSILYNVMSPSAVPYSVGVSSSTPAGSSSPPTVSLTLTSGSLASPSGAYVLSIASYANDAVFGDVPTLQVKQTGFAPLWYVPYVGSFVFRDGNLIVTDPAGSLILQTHFTATTNTLRLLDSGVLEIVNAEGNRIWASESTLWVGTTLTADTLKSLSGVYFAAVENSKFVVKPVQGGTAVFTGANSLGSSVRIRCVPGFLGYFSYTSGAGAQTYTWLSTTYPTQVVPPGAYIELTETQLQVCDATGKTPLVTFFA